MKRSNAYLNIFLIYSYPYKLKSYHHLSSHFPGGSFRNVIVVSLYDERPFSNEFFIRIAQSFPLLEDLTVVNRKAQIDEQHTEPTIEYLHLKRLVLREVHHHYVEQFLIDTKVSLPNTVFLTVRYQSRPIFKEKQHESTAQKYVL